MRKFALALILSAYGCSDPTGPETLQVEFTAPSGNLVVQTGVVTPVELCISVDGPAATSSWTINDQPTSQTGECIIEDQLPGEYEACVSVNGATPVCKTYTLVEQDRMINLLFRAIVAGNGPELMSGLELCITNVEPEVCFPAGADGRGTLSYEAPWNLPELELLAQGDGLIPSRIVVPAGTNRLPVFILAESSWEIKSGIYTGEVIPISLEKAYTLSNDGVSAFYPRTRISGLWRYPHVYIGEDDIPIIFDRAQPYVFTVSDSTATAEANDSSSERLGEVFFRMGSADEGRERCAYVLHTTNSASGWTGGGSSICNLYTHFFNITGGNIAWQTIPPNTEETSGRTLFKIVVRHELGHNMGFGHTCAWPSLMQTCAQNRDIHELTPEDVAYMLFHYRVSELRIKYSPSLDNQRVEVTGLGELHNGERGLLELDPVPIWYHPDQFTG